VPQFQAKKRPLEFLGQDTSFPPRRTPRSWLQGSGDRTLECPYDKRECFKITKTPPVKIIGCCVAGLPNPERRGSFEAIITCPKRFFEGATIFKDINRVVFGNSPLRDRVASLKVFHELGTPHPHNRQVDWTLVAYDARRRIVDYIAIEIQATATGSTGPIVPARDDYFGFSRESFKDSYEYGTNITMSSKTILEQVLHKVPVFSAWRRKLVLIIQDNFLRHLKKQYNFGAFSSLRHNHEFVIFSYKLVKKAYGFSLALDEYLGGTKEDVATCILPNSRVMAEMRGLEEIFVEKFSVKPGIDVPLA
jgi:hypothetical protein